MLPPLLVGIYILGVTFHGKGGRTHEGSRGTKVTLKDRFFAFIKYIFGFLGRAIWRYGERPFRTFLTACLVVIISAFFYKISGLIVIEGTPHIVGFFDALYFSVITFATVGYGDYVPVGWVRIIAILESLAGVFLTPLFLIALTRRYLKMYK